MGYSESYPPLRGFASDAIIIRKYDAFPGTARIEHRLDPSQHFPPSVRRRIRADGPNARWTYHRTTRPSQRRIKSSAYPYRNPSITEAWLIVDEWLRNRHQLRMTDVILTESRGTFLAKYACGDPQAIRQGNCEGRCGIRHIYHLWEGHDSWLSVSGEYEGGGYHRDAQGRMLSPYRTWKALYEDAIAQGSDIAYHVKIELQRGSYRYDYEIRPAVAPRRKAA